MSSRSKLALPITIAALLGGPGLAQTTPDAGPSSEGQEIQRTRCRVEGVSLSVVIRSHGDEPELDETSVWIEHDSARLRVPFSEPARFVLERGEVTSRGVSSACADTVALAHMTNRQILVLLAMDARPQGNELGAFVYDTRARKVTKVVSRLFPYGRALRADIWKDALLITSQRALDSPFGQCPEHCPAVRGSRVVRLQGDELAVTWRWSLSGGWPPALSLGKTRVDSGLGGALRTDPQFAHAAGVPKDGSKIERTFKVTAELEDGRRCFALLAAQRMPTDDEWTCRR